MSDLGEDILNETRKVFNSVRTEASSAFKSVAKILDDASNGIYSNISFGFDGDKYSLSLDVPGFSKSDLRVQVVERGLKISGNCTVTAGAEKTMNNLYKIPAAADHEEIKAALLNGVLTITMPRRKINCIEVEIHNLF